VLAGWIYAKITDVIVHRVHDGQALDGETNTAELVFSNGCRNPAYQPLAPYNPWRDVGNGLINNFDFRVFMFQEMLSGDSIMISAKVIACVEEIDCAPVSYSSLFCEFHVYQKKDNFATKKRTWHIQISNPGHGD
jgi:hypothetical protein